MNDAIKQGLAHADQTRVVEVGRGVLSRAGSIIAENLDADGRPVLVVADERTWTAAGQAVQQSLLDAGVTVADPLIFPGTPALSFADFFPVFEQFKKCHLKREKPLSRLAFRRF